MRRAQRSPPAQRRVAAPRRDLIERPSNGGRHMKETVQRVVTALAEAGVRTEVREVAASTRTAEDAANALGTTVGQIVKSLVFLAGDRPILVLVSGVNRADTAKLQALVDAEITRANADDLRRITGYSTGALPPLGHPTFLTTYPHPHLLHYHAA